MDTSVGFFVVINVDFFERRKVTLANYKIFRFVHIFSVLCTFIPDSCRFAVLFCFVCYNFCEVLCALLLDTSFL